MRGHIEKRYKSSYTIIVDIGKDPATGRRRQQCVSVKGTKKDAEKRLAEMLHQIDTGVIVHGYDPPGGPIFHRIDPPCFSGY